MTGTPDINAKIIPWHLWLVGVVSFLWSAMGARDYLMTQTKNTEYMAKFTTEQLDFYYGFPVWVEATWALAVWGGVLGALLLLFRRRLAEPVFLVSMLSMVATTIHNYGIANGFEVAGGTFPLVFTAIIFLAAVGFWLYARAMRAKGVLV